MNNNRHKGLIFYSKKGGHRDSYAETFSKILPFKLVYDKNGLIGKSFLQIIKNENLLLTDIDSNLVLSIFLFILRAILQKKSVGIFIRSKHVFSERFQIKTYLKQKLFALVSLFENIKIVCITSPKYQPENLKISNFWIDDPQFWDLYIEREPIKIKKTHLSESVLTKSLGKPIIIYIGRILRRKNFLLLVDFIKNNDKYFVVIAGESIHEEEFLLNEIKDYPNIYLESKWVSNDEILSLYEISSFVWCNYSENYDQSSGVFGRAIQLEKTPIIRKESLINKIADDYGIPYCYLLENDLKHIKSGTEKLSFQNLVNQNFNKINDWFK